MEKEKLTNEENLNLRASNKTEIFKAKFNGEVVISKKISLASSDKLLRGRIKKREILIMSYLNADNNQNLVKFHGWIEESNYIKIIMEYLEGKDLYEYIGEDVKYDLSEKQKAKILLDVAKGLKFLHERNIIYRDLKSGNVLIDKEITDDTLDFTAKIVDFGISRKIEEFNQDDPDTDDNSSGMTAKSGTNKYFAPEQDSSDYDYKVDIYAFAMMAYELFSKTICYSDPITMRFNDNTLRKKVKEGLRPNKNLNVDIPQEILDMCEKNWKLDPEDRETAEELVETMQDIYENI